MFVERWNFYRCSTCVTYWVTVDVHEGKTPEKIRCRGGNCDGWMVSAEYPKPENWPAVAPREANAEWFRPGEYHRARIKKLHPSIYVHILNGGLIQRPPTRVHEFPTVVGGS